MSGFQLNTKYIEFVPMIFPAEDISDINLLNLNIFPNVDLPKTGLVVRFETLENY
jgi:hypothetical protein